MPDLTASGVRADFEKLLSNGAVYRFRYFNATYNTGSYDDFVVLTISGNDFYTSGLVLPLNTKEGSDDAVLFERGLVFSEDSKLYVRYDVTTSGPYKIGISGTGDSGIQYSMLVEGTLAPKINDQVLFKK